MSKRDDELNRFVREALANGSARPEIQTALQQAGWWDAQIDKALDAYFKADCSIPVPTPKPYILAREVYWYLVLFSTLYLCSFGLGSLIFNIIEQQLPDPIRPDYRTEESIRWAISLLAVAAPIFLFAANRISRMLLSDPTLLGSPMRKWLTYIALLVAGAFFIGDATTLLFWFLGGELTTRIFLKIATVAVISGAIYGYYMLELKRDERS